MKTLIKVQIFILLLASCTKELEILSPHVIEGSSDSLNIDQKDIIDSFYNKNDQLTDSGKIKFYIHEYQDYKDTITYIYDETGRLITANGSRYFQNSLKSKYHVTYHYWSGDRITLTIYRQPAFRIDKEDYLTIMTDSISFECSTNSQGRITCIKQRYNSTREYFFYNADRIVSTAPYEGWCGLMGDGQSHYWWTEDKNIDSLTFERGEMELTVFIYQKIEYSEKTNQHHIIQIHPKLKRYFELSDFIEPLICSPNKNLVSMINEVGTWLAEEKSSVNKGMCNIYSYDYEFDSTGILKRIKITNQKDNSVSYETYSFYQ